MRQNNRSRLLCLLILVLCLLPITSLMADDVPSVTPTDAPVVTATDVATEIATQVPTDVPTEAATNAATEIPTEAPTEVVTETATVETPSETPTAETPVATGVTGVTVTEAATAAPVVTEALFAPEPRLTLVLRDLFEEGSLPTHWVFPAGWLLTSTTNGGAVQINAATAGASHRAMLSDSYADVAVMGSFTFSDQTSTVQLVVRESNAGFYTATLSASGLATLEKHDNLGAVVVLGTADISAQIVPGTGRDLRLSVMGSVLRVTVGGMDVITVQDALPLPAGQVSVQANVTATTATLLFDNFFLWIPSTAVVTPTDVVVTPVTPEPPTPTEKATENSERPPSNPVVLLAALPAPALTAPAANGTFTTLRPTFIWTMVTGANRYHLRVAVDSSCTTPVSADFDVVVATNTFTPLAPVLLNQGEYWVCVESQNITNGTASGFGEKRRFVVDVALKPADGSVMVMPVNPDGTANVNVGFTWTNTSAMGFIATLQVDNDSDMGSPQINFAIPAATFSPSGLTFGTYYWRMSVNGTAVPAALAHRITFTPALPLAPVIHTPASIPHLGLTNDTTPLLNWNVPTNWVTPALGQSLTYELQLSTNIGFTALVAPTVIGLATPDHEWTETTLANTPGTVYFWRVRAKTNLDLYSPYSPIYRFTLDTVAPNPPTTLTAPADNAVSTAARPAFSWAVAPTANGYLLELSNAIDFNTLGFGSPYPATLTSLALPISQPQDSNPLYWRVRAKDAAGNISTPSAYRTLRIDYAVAPAAGFAKVLVGTTPSAPMVFSWTPVAGLTGAVYNVSIFTDSGLTTQLHTSGLIAPATWTSPTLPIGEYWWVLSVNGMGTSLVRRFVVSGPLPGVPAAPLAPTTASFTNNTTPSFNWGTPVLNPGNIQDYELQIATGNTFTAPFQVAGSPYTVTTRPFTITTALPDTPGKVYYWRVRARTALGLYGPYSATMSFTLDTTDPTAPTSLTAPADNAVSTIARPAFSWPAGVGANRYKIEISPDNGFANLIPQGIPTLASYTPTVSLPQGSYFWRVWSLDAAGNESPTPSITRTFTVDYRTAPLANATSFTATTSNVVFSWGLVTGAPVGTTYTIEIDTNFDGIADIIRPAVTTATTTAPALAQGDYQYRLTVSNGFGTSGWRTFIVSPLLPGAPVAPFAPATLSATNDTTPTLQWAAPTVNPGSVTGYMVDVSTLANFTAPIAGSPFDAGAATSITLPVLPNTVSQVYYWRVRAKAQFNLFGAYNVPLSFTLDTTIPADVPTLTAPVDNAVTTAARPPFSWSAAAGANRYKIQIDTDNAFANPILHEAISATPSYTIPAPTYLQQGTYYWRVWGLDAAGNLSAAPSVVRTLTVNYPLTPADNLVITSAVPVHVAFTWAAIPGAAANTIRIQIDNNSNFSSPERTSALLAATAITYTTSLVGSSPSTNPLPHGKYYWRLLVTGHTNPSMVRSFIISPAAPPAPALSTTTPTTATVDTTPGFGWNAVSSGAGATVTGYEFQLSTVNTFAVIEGGASVIVAGGGTTSLTWSPALPNTAGQAYFARIRAVTNLGAVSAWSMIRSFTLDTQAPLTGPNLTSPADNASVITQKPTFQWDALADAAQYDIRYGTQSDLSGITPTRITTLTYVPAGNLLLTNYYWQVRGIDAAGNIGPWSTPRVMAVSSAPGAAPTLWNYTSNMPTFTWTPLAWAVSYDIQVSNSSTFTSIIWQSTGIAASNAPSVTVTTPLPNGTYFWRVKAKLPAIVTGPHNEPFSAAYVVTVQAP